MAKTKTYKSDIYKRLTELQRHARELEVNPAAWMPWNYRDTLQVK
jgi:hypothetical protein